MTTLPAVPRVTNLFGTNPDHRGAYFAWTRVDDATGYEVQWALDSEEFTDGNQRTVTPNGTLLWRFSPSSTYKVRVRAKIGTSTGEWSEVSRATTVAIPTPAKVLNLRVTKNTDTNRYLVEWDRVHHAGAYAVEYESLEKDFFDYEITVFGQRGSLQHGTMTRNTKFRVRALTGPWDLAYPSSTGGFRDRVYGPFSDEVHVILPGSPSQMTGVSVVPEYSDMTVNWPADSTATTYYVKYWPASDEYDTELESVSSTRTSYEIHGLNPRTAYEVQVFAKNRHGTGPGSTPITVNTSDVPTLDAPDLTPHEDRVRVAWTRFRRASEHQVQWRADNQSFSSTRQENNASQPETITGLSPGTTYHFRVRAIGQHNDYGEWSASASTTTTGTSVPTTAPGVPSGVDAATSDNQITLTWTRDTGATQYTVEYVKSTLDFTHEDARSRTTAAASYTATGLLWGTTYKFRVKATNSIGSSNWSSAIQATTRPTQPTGVSLTLGQTTIAVSWNSVTGASQYRVRWATTSADLASATAQSSTTTGTTIQSLDSDALYYVQVQAVGAGGNSLWTSARSARTLTTTPVPGDIEGFGAVVSRNGITAYWDSVTGATSYDIRWTDADGETTTQNTANTLYRIFDLTPDSWYFIQVRAKNSSGNGNWMAREWAQTWPPVPAAPTVATPVSTGTTVAAIQWGMVDHAVTYKVQWRTSSQQFSNLRSESVTTNRYNLDGLDANTSYYVRVRAYNRVGHTSRYSTVVTATTTDGSSLCLDVGRFEVRRQAVGQTYLSWQNSAGGLDVDRRRIWIQKYENDSWVHERYINEPASSSWAYHLGQDNSWFRYAMRNECTNDAEQSVNSSYTYWHLTGPYSGSSSSSGAGGAGGQVPTPVPANPPPTPVRGPDDFGPPYPPNQ